MQFQQYHKTLLLLLVVQFSSLPVLALKKVDFQCYVCTSDDPHCEENVDSSYAQQCFEGVAACGIYAYDYEFVFGTKFHRACIYKSDLDGRHRIYPLGYEENKQTWAKYTDGMDFWDRKRDQYNSEVGHPPRVKIAPTDPGKFFLKVFNSSTENKSLSNSIDLSKWKESWWKSEKPAKQVGEITCFSCTANVTNFVMQNVQTDIQVDFHYTVGVIESPGIPCGEDFNPPKIKCKNAYGCATIWEMNDVEYKAGTNRKRVSRIWRGCWYPGEMACLRKSSLSSGRSLSSNGSAVFRQRKETECGKAYQRSVELEDGNVVWVGKKNLVYPKQYNDYLQCLHEIRAGLGQATETRFVDPAATESTMSVQYYFCGPNENCNESPEDYRPVTTPFPVTKRSTTSASPSTTTESPDGLEVDEENCKIEESRKKNGVSALAQKPYFVGLFLLTKVAF